MCRCRTYLHDSEALLTKLLSILVCLSYPLVTETPAFAAPPMSWSLTNYIVRIHNQGSSNSCVAQTLSTIMEIEVSEFAASHPEYAAHHPFYKRWTAFSPAFVYNQLDFGSKYTWMSLDSVMRLVTTQGIAPLDTFAADPNNNWRAQPDRRARHYAQFHRFSWWKQIGTWDKAGIESEVRAGHPLLALMPIYASFYNNWNGGWPVLSYLSGYYLYDHAMTIVGYGPTGVTILNSWGARWGFHGLATISWSALRAYGKSVVVAYLKDPRTIPR